MAAMCVCIDERHGARRNVFLWRSTSLDAVGHEAILSVFLGHQGVFGS